MIGACLAQGTAWKAVARSLDNLRTRDLLDLAPLRALPECELRELIRPSGFMERKAKTLRLLLDLIAESYESSIEAMAAMPTGTLRKQLLAIHGIGPETADSILLYALGHPAMVVDEYLRRVVVRHGLLSLPARYQDLQAFALLAFEPYANSHSDSTAQLHGKAKTKDSARRRATHTTSLAQAYNEFHAMIVELGKAHCGRKPNCEACPLREDLKNYQNDQPVPY